MANPPKNTKVAAAIFNIRQIYAVAWRLGNRKSNLTLILSHRMGEGRGEVQLRKSEIGALRNKKSSKREDCQGGPANLFGNVPTGSAKKNEEPRENTNQNA